MCGIAGYFGNINFINNNNRLRKILGLMKFRGPDGNGVFQRKLDKKLFLRLFHSRLSIIDPHTRSNQPFEDNEGVISFNGMIYNYREIKKDLLTKGKKFITGSDTEVLLKFLNYYGIDKLDKLEGMWSFAYYNFKNRKLIICRDRFGEKPLYFFKNAKNVIFGSSIDYILNISKLKHKIDKKQIQLYLKNGFRSLFFDIEAKSFFKKINTLTPGKYYEIDSNLNFKTKNYWYPQKVIISKKKKYSNEVKKLKKIYKRSLIERTRSDFPVACLLSGGIDSGSIASCIPRKTNNLIHYFSAYTKDKNYDESDHIQKIVKNSKLKHTFVKVEKNNEKNFKIISTIIKRTGNLVPTVSWLLFSYICQEIKKKKFKVVLTGTGGDEIFAGYYAHHLHFLQSLKLNKNKKIFKKNYDNWSKFISPLLRNKGLKNFDFYSKNYQKIDQSKFEYLSINKYFKKYNYQKKIKTNFLKDYFKNELYKELFYSSLPPQIFATDSISMYYNLESRLPLLSGKFYNFSFSSPNNFLIRNAFNKAIFRDSLKGSLPKEVLNKREKVGFFKNIDEFFNFKSKNLQHKILGNKYVNSFLNLKEFKRMLTKDYKTNQECHLIFSVMNIVIYLEKYKRYI
tara:strand:- start:17439 stop:19304 length:1866 start_codon:yes stop_codon:yes gene_type:complete